MTEIQLTQRAQDHTRCPYCHDLLVTDESLTECPSCQAQHHPTCAVEIGRCASCQSELDGQIATSDRPCSFFHDCGVNAIVGDSLCADHRRRVNLATPRLDLGGMHAEALELASGIQKLSTFLGWASFLLILPVIVLATRLDWSTLVTVWALILVVGGASAAQQFFARRARRLRTLLEAIPATELQDGPARPPAIRIDPKSPPVDSTSTPESESEAT